MKSKTVKKGSQRPTQYLSLDVDSPEEAWSIFNFFAGWKGIELDIWFDGPPIDEDGNLIADDNLNAPPSPPEPDGALALAVVGTRLLRVPSK